MYKIGFDTCTYTLDDVNSMSTIFENICEAKEKGLEGICIMSRGHVHNFDKTDKTINSILSLPNEIKGVKILKGLECSLLTLGRADIDVPLQLIKNADFSLVSYYSESFSNFIPDGEKISQTIKNVLNLDNVDGIGQFTFCNASVNLRDLILFCKKNNKFIELSNDKLINNKISEADMYKIIVLCKDFNLPIIVSSGARIFSDVGNFDDIIKILEKANFPQELILNETLDKFKKYLSNE